MRHDPNLSLSEGRQVASFEKCGCSKCGAYPLDIEDMASSRLFKPKALEALFEAYDGPVCCGCAHDAVFCDWCGDVADDDQTAMRDGETLHFCSAGCEQGWRDAPDE